MNDVIQSRDADSSVDIDVVRSFLNSHLGEYKLSFMVALFELTPFNCLFIHNILSDCLSAILSM